MPLQTETKEKIKKEVIAFGQSVMKKSLPIGELKRAFPFHSVFFSDEGLRAFKEQRTLVTRMGMQLFPKIALITARDRHLDVKREHVIDGKADSGMISKADRVMDDLRTGKRRPDYKDELREITASKTGKYGTYRVTADLFVGDFKSGPLFLEIKAPRPNLDQCVESKKKMWYFRIMNLGTPCEAYLAFPYNPFVSRDKYAHAFTARIMDMNKEVLIGEEMWDKLGGQGTYDELIRILEQVKSEVKWGK